MRRARGNGYVFVRHVRDVFVLEILLCDGDCLFLGEIAGNRQHGVFCDVVLVVIIFERLARHLFERLFCAENCFFKRTTFEEKAQKSL